MRKKTFPPLLKSAFEKNAVTITIPPDFHATITATGSKVKCYYPSPKEIRPGGFWQKKSPCILHAIINQLPPPKDYTKPFLLDLFSQKVH